MPPASPMCVKCGKEMSNWKNGIWVVFGHQEQAYFSYVHADLKGCQYCNITIIDGWATGYSRQIEHDEFMHNVITDNISVFFVEDKTWINKAG
jgi:hypothetical protein